MLNLEIIPFVGYDVEEYTPFSKYEDLNELKTHYKLNSTSLEEDFPLMANYKELKNDSKFQTIRQVIMKKDFISDVKYQEVSLHIANEMKINLEIENDLMYTVAKNLEQSISNKKDKKLKM